MQYSHTYIHLPFTIFLFPFCRLSTVATVSTNCCCLLVVVFASVVGVVVLLSPDGGGGGCFCCRCGAGRQQGMHWILNLVLSRNFHTFCVCEIYIWMPRAPTKQEQELRRIHKQTNANTVVCVCVGKRVYFTGVVKTAITTKVN